MHLLAEWFVFVSDYLGFLKEGVKTYLMAPMSPLNSPTFSVFTSVVSVFLSGKMIGCDGSSRDVCDKPQLHRFSDSQFLVAERPVSPRRSFSHPFHV
jgi:hypothetical protein